MESRHGASIGFGFMECKEHILVERRKLGGWLVGTKSNIQIGFC